MPTKSAMTAAGSAAAVTVTLLAGATTSAHAQPTCRGLEATHVGTPGQDLVGTAGDDVIVTNRAEHVRARGGDDLVCVTGDGRTFITDGSGDDMVDASRHGRCTVSMTLVAGSDTYLGQSSHDALFLGRGATTDHDRVGTRTGNDTIYSANHIGRLTVSLGRGRDRIYESGNAGRFRIDGGRGRDLLEFDGHRTVRVRLDKGPIVNNGRRNGTVRRIEDVRAYGRSVTVYGTKVRNRLRVGACASEAHGKYGRDVLAAFNRLDRCDGPARMTFYGGPGADALRGWYGPDRLYGGRGADFAVGRDGRDLCRAERKRSCER